MVDLGWLWVALPMKKKNSLVSYCSGLGILAGSLGHWCTSYTTKHVTVSVLAGVNDLLPIVLYFL